MPSFDCTFPECKFSTGEQEKEIALQFLIIHGHSHAQFGSVSNISQPRASPQSDKSENIKIFEVLTKTVVVMSGTHENSTKTFETLTTTFEIFTNLFKIKF